MSLRNITVQYVGDTLYLPPLERVVNHIIARKDANDLEHFVQVVRCKDCTYSVADGTMCNWFTSYNGFSDNAISAPVEPDGFCAWGEKRTKLDDARDVQ